MKGSALIPFCLVLVCTAEPACEAVGDSADGGDDTCQMLQEKVGLVKDHAKLVKKGHHEYLVKKDEHNKAEGIPDLLKHVTDAVGGVDTVQKDFENIAAEVGRFSQEVYEASSSLAASAKPSMSIDEIRIEVEAAYGHIAEAATRIHHAVAKMDTDFMPFVSSALPANIKSQLKGIVDKLTNEAKAFAATIKSAADELKNLEDNGICDSVKGGIAKMEAVANEIAGVASDLIKFLHGPDVVKLENALPKSIKDALNKITAKATKAAELAETLPEQVQEIAKGIAKAFGHHCTGIYSAAGRLEVSLLSVVVAVMLGTSL